MPFSFRQPIAKIEEVKMNNDFGSLLIDMKLFGNVQEALPFYKSVFGKMKNSLAPFGVLLATQLTVALPFNLPKIMADDMTRKFTFVYSNLNASKKRYVFNGRKMLGQFFFAPGINKLSSGVSILTIGDVMSVAVFSDAACMEHPQELVDHFVRINDSCMRDVKDE